MRRQESQGSPLNPVVEFLGIGILLALLLFS
jgi:hypothetical protein